jgi:hypothetical protein
MPLAIQKTDLTRSTWKTLPPLRHPSALKRAWQTGSDAFSDSVACVEPFYGVAQGLIKERVRSFFLRS